MIALVTDSNSQLPPELADRYDVEVVPLTVVIDGVDHLEGVDLDADGFYARFEGGATPEVATSQPSPGTFGEVYQQVADRGATEILSIHIGSAVSGTLNSARLAVSGAPVPVRLVDTGTASFGIACAVWEAAEALQAGASLEEAAGVAERLAEVVGNVFVVQAFELARAGGRVDVEIDDSTDALPVLSLVGSDLEVVGEAHDVASAARIMADRARAAGEGLRVAIGIADAGAAPFYEALEAELADAPQVQELVRYRIGPSVGVHTGPGTAGVFFYPTSFLRGSGA